MIKIITTVFLLSLTFQYGLTQNQKPSFASNPDLSFEKFISGVKYAEIGLNILDQEQVDNKTGIAGFYYVAQKYLNQIGFEYVALTSAEKSQLDISIRSYCEYTLVMFGGDINNKSISNMTISFISCNGDIFTFTSDKKYTYRKFTDVEKKLIEDWQSLVKLKKNYQMANQLKLPQNPTAWNKDKIMNYYSKNQGNLKQVEGVYERVRLSFEDITGGKYTVAIIKNPDADEFLMIYLSGAKNNMDWQQGEIKAVLTRTATSGFYSVQWITRDKSLHEDVYCNIDPLGINIFSSGVVPISYQFIKTFPLTD